MTSEARGAIVGASGSILLHLCIYLAVATRSGLPDLPFELEVPDEVEFGLTEATTVRGAVPRTTVVATATPATQAASPGVQGPDAGVPSGASVDAGSRDGSRAMDGGRDATSEQSASTDAGDGGDASTRLPAGAQIAIRIDLAAIRASPLAEDVRRLLRAIPDWQLLLEGSGIDPLTDLDRLLIASPNLERSRLILAGRHRHEVDVRSAVDRLAQATSTDPGWREELGVPVARWANRDETERVVALIGRDHFTISRAEDLPRIVALAQARADSRPGPGDGGPGGLDAPGNREGDAPLAVHPAEALLSMGPREVFTVEIEGARRFVRRTPRGAPQGIVPLRLSLALVEEGRGAMVAVQAEFDDVERAEGARAYWDGVRRETAARAVVDLGVVRFDLGRPLRDGEIRLEGSSIRFRTQLTRSELRMLLGYLRGMFLEASRVATSTNRSTDGGRELD